MIRTNAGNAVRGAFVAATLALMAPVASAGQGGEGYLFKQPTVTLEFETGYGFQRASGDIFDQVIADYTLGRRDFDSPYIGGELGFRASERVDVTVGFGYQASSAASEFRDWVDQDGFPITQVTELSQIPLTLGAKYYLAPRGRNVSRFAWIPRRVVPFVGASAGLVSYSFRQYGDFIDFTTDEIFYDTLESKDKSFLGRASAGVNLTIADQFFVSFEGRYNLANADMTGSYGGFTGGFNKIDLSGLQFLGGIAVRF